MLAFPLDPMVFFRAFHGLSSLRCAVSCTVRRTCDWLVEHDDGGRERSRARRIEYADGLGASVRYTRHEYLFLFPQRVPHGLGHARLLLRMMIEMGNGFLTFRWAGDPSARRHDGICCVVVGVNRW